MELEKSNKKRVFIEQQEEEEEQEQQSDRSVLKKLKQSEKEEENNSSSVPTEEEVEEFFAILRRMKVAVKYFDGKGKGRKEWREALEQAEVTVDDDGQIVAGEVAHKTTDNKGTEVIIHEGFDLNAVAPEAAEHGGA